MPPERCPSRRLGGRFRKHLHRVAAETDNPDMSDRAMELTVVRWRRYGKDRLYVKDPAGTDVGWWDLTTDEAHPTVPEHLEPLTTAVMAWRTDQSPPTPASVAAVSPPPVAVPERPWIDLATNHPGDEAREKAEAARDAAPVRSLLARVLNVHTDERAWRLGAIGEEKVAAELVKVAKKDPRWRFLHALPVGRRGSDIDHLVLGPGGVFTINTKHHPNADIWVGGNTFLVNGHRQPYVRNSRHEAMRAARLLTEACGFPVHVEGLIVTVNAHDVVVKTQPEGVHVVWRNQLAKWLLRHGDVCPEATLDAIHDIARRSTTWSG
jgi:hypothetical protein